MSLPIETCKRCEKPLNLCVCEAVSPQTTKLEIIILQHPQEPDKELGTARLAELSLTKCKLKIGLSWRNLKSLAGENADPKEWGVLYLGSSKLSSTLVDFESPLVAVAKTGNPLPDSDMRIRALKGIILLDGTWSQAKALWWRNPWLLKLQRLVLRPTQRSLYSRTRREPRKECLSTIESAGLALTSLEKNFNQDQLLAPFRKLLDLYRNRNK